MSRLVLVVDANAIIVATSTIPSPASTRRLLPRIVTLSGLMRHRSRASDKLRGAGGLPAAKSECLRDLPDTCAAVFRLLAFSSLFPARLDRYSRPLIPPHVFVRNVKRNKL